jgi:hypothetical protein
MAQPEMPAPVAAWHRIADARDPAGLADLLADDCVFRSPAVHTPQEGKALTTAYLSAAIVVLGPTLTYRRQWYAADSAVLEFAAELDGLAVHGVDMLAWGPDGRVTEFAVMVRPVKALHKLMELMAAELQR